MRDIHTHDAKRAAKIAARFVFPDRELLNSQHVDVFAEKVRVVALCIDDFDSFGSRAR